jgi:hypothetical protein
MLLFRLFFVIYFTFISLSLAADASKEASTKIEGNITRLKEVVLSFNNHYLFGTEDENNQSFKTWKLFSDTLSSLIEIGDREAEELLREEEKRKLRYFESVDFYVPDGEQDRYPLYMEGIWRQVAYFDQMARMNLIRVYQRTLSPEDKIPVQPNQAKAAFWLKLVPKRVFMFEEDLSPIEEMERYIEDEMCSTVTSPAHLPSEAGSTATVPACPPSLDFLEQAQEVIRFTRLLLSEETPPLAFKYYKSIYQQKPREEIDALEKILAHGLRVTIPIRWKSQLSQEALRGLQSVLIYFQRTGLIELEPEERGSSTVGYTSLIIKPFTVDKGLAEFMLRSAFKPSSKD